MNNADLLTKELLLLTYSYVPLHTLVVILFAVIIHLIRRTGI